MAEFEERYLRRASHTVGACAILYYALPDSLYGTPKWTIPLLAVVLSTIGEVHRLREGALVPGQREHERGRIASYYQFGLSMVLLVLLFPQSIAVPCLLLAAFVDPILGETRGRSGAVPAAFLLGVAIFIASGYEAGHFALICAGSIGAIVFEHIAKPPLDDDVTIPMGTAVLLWAMSHVYELPSGIIEPIRTVIR